MDPKQNNDSFGSLSSGGDGPMAGGAGAAGGVPEVGAAPVAGTSAVGAPEASTPVANAPVAGNPATNNPVASNAATGTPAVAGGNTIFPGAVGAAGVSGFGGMTSVGSAGAGFGSTSGTNPVASNPFGQTSTGQGQANAFFAQGNMNTGMPIGSGTGDVVIGGDQKKNQKKMLLVGGLIALVVLIVVGLVASAIFSRGGGSDGGGSDVANQKSAFNSYANYVLFGEDSDEDLTEEEIYENSAYFETLDINEDVITKYTLEANKKFGELERSYAQDNDPYWQTAFTDMSDFFQKLPSALPLTVKELSDAFASGGRSGAEELIDRRYSTSDYSSDEDGLSSMFLDYLDAASSLSALRLNVIEKAKEGGCVISDSLENSCYTMNESEIQEAEGYFAESNDSVEAMRQNAFLAIQNMFNKIYGYDNENEEIDEEVRLDDNSQDNEGADDEA